MSVTRIKCYGGCGYPIAYCKCEKDEDFNARKKRKIIELSCEAMAYIKKAEEIGGYAAIPFLMAASLCYEQIRVISGKSE